MKIALLHPTGNQFVRATVSAFLKADVLAEFATTLASDSTAAWLKLLPDRMRQEWLRRTFAVPAQYLWTHPTRELTRIIMAYLGFYGYARYIRNWTDIDAVYQNLDQAVARRLSYLQEKRGVDTVYAYEDGALTTFEQAKALGIRCIYDLPIAYWETGRHLMLEEAARLPHWAPTLGGGTQDSATKLERKVRELELADTVIGPGKFVMDSLPPWAHTKQIVMVPFGSPASREVNSASSQLDSERPLRVLFIGAMSQRKGLADLFAAVRLLNRPDLELVVLGTLLAPMSFYREQLPEFIYEPGRPHSQVLDLISTCDVFCLPSIVEGRALVMQEAMSQGLPLIITPNTGGEDLIQEGQTGFLVPIRSPHIIAEKLAWFLDNRAQVPIMGHRARAHAATYTWESYGTRIITSLMESVH